MTVTEALKQAASLLASSGTITANIETPALDAGLLLGKLLHLDKAGLILNGKKKLSEKKYLQYQELLKRRLDGECIAYILGHREFFGLEIIVNNNVLVPRPETEILVEKGLELISARNPKTSKTILDLCTGSGAIAIAMKHKMPELEVWASDISKKALAMAHKNSARHNTRIHFIKSDLFSNIKNSFDMIITNPPYICSGKISSLAPEVKREPRLALDGGHDGLDLIRRIIQDSVQHLLPGGILLMEADNGQEPIIEKLLFNAGLRECRTFNDLSGQFRLISASYR